MTAYVLTDSATMLRRSLRRMRRYPSLTLFIAGMPVVFLLLFVYVFGGTLGAGLGAGSGAAAGGSTARRYIAYVAARDPARHGRRRGPGTAISVAMDMTEGIIARFRTMADRARLGARRATSSAASSRRCSRSPSSSWSPCSIGFRPTTGPLEWLAAAGAARARRRSPSPGCPWRSGMVTDSVETASNLPMFLILLPFLSSGFVPTESMPGPLGLVRRAPAVHADHRDACAACSSARRSATTG